MHPNLVFSTGFQIDLQQRKLIIAFNFLIVGNGLLTMLRVLRRVDNEGLALFQPGRDGPLFLFHLTLNDTNIGALVDGCRPGLLDLSFNRFIFGKHQ